MKESIKKFLNLLNDKFKSVDLASHTKSLLASLRAKFQMPRKTVKVVLIGGMVLVIAVIGIRMIQGKAKPQKIRTPRAIAVQQKLQNTGFEKTQNVQQFVERKPFDFVKAVIRSLKLAKDADEMLRPRTSQEQSVSDLNMKAMRYDAMGKLTAAQNEIQPFLLSRDIDMRRGAQDFQLCYTLLIRSIIVNSVNSQPSVPVQTANLPPTLIQATQATSDQKNVPNGSNIKSRMTNAIWKILLYATTIRVKSVLVDKSREDHGTGVYLTITENERTELLNDLTVSFGDSIKQGVQVGQRSTGAAPALLWMILNRPAVKTVGSQASTTAAAPGTGPKDTTITGSSRS